MKIQTQFHEGQVPSDVHLVLLVLDYLMDLRRNNDAVILNSKKNLDADYISLAIFALMRSIKRPDYLACKSSKRIFDAIDIDAITDEVLTSSPTFQRPYDIGYNDLHPSNLYRFYELDGLAGGPDNGPMLLTELVEAGLGATSARCRLEAEKDIIKSTQFELYIQSVTNRGFFNDPANSGRRKDPQEEEERRARKALVYKEKYRKAIGKYREKLAMNMSAADDLTDMSLLSPPNSPPNMAIRSARGFASPPRTCQVGLLSRDGPLSPLTPTTLERTFSPPTSPTYLPVSPKTPKPKAQSMEPKTPKTPTYHHRSAEEPAPVPKTPKTPTYHQRPVEEPAPVPRTPKTPKTPTPKKNPPRKSASMKRSSATVTTPNRSNSSSLLRTPARRAPPTPGKSVLSSPTRTPVRSNSAAPKTPVKPVSDSPPPSTTAPRKIEDSPQSTLARMARRRGSASPVLQDASNGGRDSPPQSTLGRMIASSRGRRSRSNSVTRRERFDSKSGVTSPNTTVAGAEQVTNDKQEQSLSPLPPKKAPESPKKTFGPPRGFSPIESPQPSQPPGRKIADLSPRRSLSPEMEVKVKAFSLYEPPSSESMSSDDNAPASFISAPSPKARRRKSEYEKRLEEQKSAAGWTCPAGLALPDMTDSLVKEEAKEIPVRKARPSSISTIRSQETKKVPSKSPKANTSEGHMKVDTGRTVDPIAGIPYGVGSHPRSPVARVRREKNQEELNRLRYGSPAPSRKSEEAMGSSPRRFPGLNPVGSRDDTSWIAQASKAAPDREETKKPRESSYSFGNNRASAFHVKTSAKSSSGSRMPANSPKSELNIAIDPFRINPPKFLGSSRLFAATVGNDINQEGTAQPAVVPGRSPRALASPRGLRGSPRNFGFNPTDIKRAC